LQFVESHWLHLALDRLAQNVIDECVLVLHRVVVPRRTLGLLTTLSTSPIRSLFNFRQKP
jgi:hypothetical protein